MKKSVTMGSILITLTLFSVPAFADYCEAHTTCASGRRISCWSRGASCTAHEDDGRDVVCVGYDLPNYQGQSHSYSESCP